MSQIVKKALAANSVDNSKIESGAAIDASKIADGSVSNAEFQFINSVTSNVQTQLNGKASTAAFTGDSGSGGVTGLVPAPAALDTVSNRVLHADGTFRHTIDTNKTFTFYEEFMGGISNSANGGLSNGMFSSTCSGAGTTFAVGSTNQNTSTPGIFNVGTGTTTTGRGSGVAGLMRIDGGYLIYKTYINFNNLSDNTDTYTFDVGLHDAGGVSTAPTEGIYFSYDQQSSVNWKCNTTAASTTTTTTTTTAVTAGSTSTWQELMFILNAANNEVKFYVNNTLVATHTTNISTGTAKPVIRIIKSAGTTARTAQIDYMFMSRTFSTPR